MNNSLKLTGKIKYYLQWPLYMIVLWTVMAVVLTIRFGTEAGIVSGAFILVYTLIILILYFRATPGLMTEMIAFATHYGQVQKKILKEFAMPYALLDEKGDVLWMNDAFSELIGKQRKYSKNVTELFEEVEDEHLPASEKASMIRVEKEGKVFSAEMKRVYADELLDNASPLASPGGADYLIALCLYDETKLVRAFRELEANTVVFGQVFVDNYEEVLEGVEDVRRSLLMALVERKIMNYFRNKDGILRKLGHDKYFFVIKRKSLEECAEGHFSILDEVKTVNIGNDMSLTLSIGIGYGFDTYLQNADASSKALELALGRGGDQAVVQDGVRTRFYGGKSESTEKMTRVKARVKAHALHEIIDGKARLVVMGHRMSDIDAIGAAIGIYRIAKTAGKMAHIVADDVDPQVQEVIAGFRKDPEYEKELFIDRERAIELTGPDTALVIVDTNRSGYTACEELLALTNTVVVLDHHRQGDERIREAVLSYIEPYASSACEMVAEIVQYFSEDMKLRPIEADAMYAGIVVDTGNFTSRTGVRTFEAAAYLRRNGADITRVRKMFREDADDLMAKATVVSHAEIFDNSYALSVCDPKGLHSPTVVAAQAANELLNMSGVKASFVLTNYNGQIYISARAIDEVNVQLIMERLGGGGHLNMAGAQIPDLTISEAKELLIRTIREMKEEGDI